MKRKKMTVIENLKTKDLEDWFLNVQTSMLLKSKFIELDKHNESNEINNRKAMSEILCMPPCFNEDAKQTSEEDIIQLVKSGTARSLAIVGQTEIGKTHLLKQLLKRKDIINSYEYIFYVSLKFHVCSKNTNVLKFLVGSESPKHWMDCTTSEDFNIFKDVVEKIDEASRSRKVCIIFDDFINLDLTFKKFENNFERYANPTDLFKKEIKTGSVLFYLIKKWFRNSQKILLLHPWQYYQLSKSSLEIKSMVYIAQGLNETSQRALVRRMNIQSKCTKINCVPNDDCLGFGTTCQKNECLVCIHCINSNCHHEIKCLCYVPSICCETLQKFKTNRFIQTKTIAIAASVLVIRLENAFIYNGCINCQFDHIAKFAWNNYSQKQYFFDQFDIASAKLTSGELFYFFSIRVIGTDNEFCFSHLFLQELLAALWLLFCQDEDFKEEMRSCANLFHDRNFDVVREFIDVICDDIRLQKKLAYACRKSNINHQNLKKRQRDLKHIGCIKMLFKYLRFAYNKILNILDLFRVNLGTKKNW